MKSVPFGSLPNLKGKKSKKCWCGCCVIQDFREDEREKLDKKLMSEANPHIGSSFEEFLEEEGMLDEIEALAIKRVLTLRV